MPGVELIEAHREAHLQEVRALFTEYNEAVDVDLCFLDFDGELAALPGEYAPPSGLLLLAVVEDKTAGCVALRRIEASVCEMKRLFVRPSFRGMSIGKRLVTAIIDEARNMGLVNRLVEPGEALAAACSLGREIAAFPQRCMRSDRLSSYEQWALDLEEALANETERGIEVIASGETREGATRFARGAGRHGSF